MIYADNKLIDGDPAGRDEGTRFIAAQIPKDTKSVTISGASVMTEFDPMIWIF